MATFKAEVYAHQKKADGTYNIKIRVTQNMRKKYLSTPWYVTREDLTRSLKLKNQKYIDLTDDLIKKYRSRCDRVGEAIKTMTVEQVVEIITSDNQEVFDLDIVAYGRAYAKQLEKEGRSGTARTYTVAINSLVRFMEREEISIKEITVKMINDWIAWLQKLPARPNRERGSRAQSLYPSVLRAIHNKAKAEFNDEDAGIIRIPLSPFKRVAIPKVPKTRKRALTVEQLQKFVKHPYTMIMQPGTNRHNLAKDVFLLSFLLLGMNEADLFTCTDCKNGRLTYQRKKTRTRRDDNAEISIKIEPEAKALMEKYKDPTGERVFNFYRLYSSIDTFTAAINKGLKTIGDALEIPDLEFYAARHSWATIALNDAGVDKYTVHAALNHVDDSMKVTDIYLRKSWEPNDKANRAVLDLVNLNYDVKEERYLPKQK